MRPPNLKSWIRPAFLQVAAASLTGLDAQNYLVLLTDGKSNYGSNPVKEAAATCKNAGVRIVTVGIGSGIDEPILKEVAYSLPNYYLHTVYDDLHKTLPQRNIEVMDCSSVWNMEVDYSAYLNLDSIKSTIKHKVR